MTKTGKTEEEQTLRMIEKYATSREEKLFYLKELFEQGKLQAEKEFAEKLKIKLKEKMIVNTDVISYSYDDICGMIKQLEEKGK